MLVREVGGMTVWHWLPVVPLQFGTHDAARWISQNVFSSESLMGSHSNTMPTNKPFFLITGTQSSVLARQHTQCCVVHL